MTSWHWEQIGETGQTNEKYINKTQLNTKGHEQMSVNKEEIAANAVCPGGCEEALWKGCGLVWALSGRKGRECAH